MSAVAARAREAVRLLESKGSQRVCEEQRTRYGITAEKAFGVPMNVIQALAKRLGRDHALAQALWESGWYEARLLAAYVADPSAVSARQMDQWARGWDNWGVVDTHCFVLFDRSPLAWKKVEQWSRRKEEYIRRGAFALLACLALHDRTAPEARFLATIPLLERAATDDRNFVRKAVAWALRAMGAPRRPAVRRAVIALAGRLVASGDPTAQALGRGALKDLKVAGRRSPRAAP